MCCFFCLICVLLKIKCLATGTIPNLVAQDDVTLLSLVSVAVAVPNYFEVLVL